MSNTLIEIQKLNEEVESLVIRNDEQLENANKLAKECNVLIKKVKAEHKEEIEKYYALHKEAKSAEKSDLAPLEKAKVILKDAIGTYMKEREAKQLELKKQKEDEVALFGKSFTETTEVNLGGTHVRKTWKARIVDESKVPVAYGKLVIRPVDMSKLNDIAKYEQGKAEIPGVEFYQEESVIVR